MPLEIERKYLVAEIGLLAHPDRIRLIESSYLSTGDPEVRIARHRDRENSYLLTVKAGTGLVRTEVETRINDTDGQQLMKMVSVTPQIEKTRYWLGPWEYDVYHGRFDGLHVLEIELPWAEATLPPPPAGLKLLVDVTDDVRFKNKRLALADDATASALLREYHAYRHPR